jgi:hypothetical protein
LPEEPVGLWFPQPAGAAAPRRERGAMLRTFMKARPGTAAVVFAIVPMFLFADSVAAYYGFRPGPARQAMLVVAGVAALMLLLELSAGALWLAGRLFMRLASVRRSWRQTHRAHAWRLLHPIRLALLALLVAFIIRPPSSTRIRLRSATRRRRRWRLPLEVGNLDFGQN